MALRIKDRVKQGSTTVGVGTISLDVSLTASGFQDFSSLRKWNTDILCY